MPRRWFPLLLALVFGLALLPATALARDHDRDGDRHRWSRDWDNDGYRQRQYRYNNNYNNGYYNNNYNNNNYNRRWRCVDPDHDGDCDYLVPRHRHHHDSYYQNGWYQNGWYGNGYPYGSYAYPYGWGSGNGWYITPPVVGNGYYGNPIGWNTVNPSRGRTAGNPPRGWNHGKKRGWGNSNLPPGLAKKSGWHW